MISRIFNGYSGTFFAPHRHVFTSDWMELVYMLCRDDRDQLQRVLSGHRLYCKCGTGREFNR